jgi:hypothetical protein
MIHGQQNVKFFKEGFIKKVYMAAVLPGAPATGAQ